MRQALICILFLAMAVPLATGQEQPLDKVLADYFAADGVRGRIAVVPKILALKPDPQEVIERLRAGPVRKGGVSTGWRVEKHLYTDGVEREYHLYVPTSFDPGTPAPLLFHMHGGVSGPATLTEEQMAGYRDWWTAEAEEWGFLVVYPLGQAGAAWWDEVGALGILGILQQIKQSLNVDVNRVFATGFSDGGSGAYYLSMTHPTFFAGFIPLNGHPAVASRASKRQLYLVNSRMRPLYAVNTQEDQLYPTKYVLPFIEQMLHSKVDVRFTSYPRIGHTPGYREEQNPLIAAWLTETERNPLPGRITWETADLEIGRASWLRILGLGETESTYGFRDVNVMMPNSGVRIGVYIDTQYRGKGVLVDRIVPRSVAEAIGLAAGDIIVKVGVTPTYSHERLKDALALIDHGQTADITAIRGEETLTLQAKFPEFVPTPTFLRDRPSGRVELIADGNRIEVRCRGVTEYALLLSPDNIEFDKEVVITTNGEESFRGVVKPDLRLLLTSHARDLDPEMLFLHRLEIRVK